MKTKKNTLFVAFASQKGGVGKSTFTALVASIMHYRLGYNVAVVDCDFPQYSLSQMRDRDMKSIMENVTFKRMAHEQFSRLNKSAYPVVKEKADAALETGLGLIESSQEQLDIIFFDLPGTVNSTGIIRALAGMHYLFIPVTADRIVLESALVFTQLITDVLMSQQHVNIRDVHLFWNRVDGRERNPLYDRYAIFIASLKLKLMDAFITSSVRFRKEGEEDSKVIFRSTLLPADQRLAEGCGLNTFIREFLELLKL